MAILLPTLENIRFLKSILMGDFEMGSAHSSECIAALIGFRSNASFLAASNSLFGRTIFETDFGAFEDRACKFGYDRDSSEQLRFCYRDLDWPEPAWILLEKRNTSARDAWFYTCQSRKIPFLYIEKVNKYFSIYWDHISVDSNYDQMVRDKYNNNAGRILFSSYQLLAKDMEPESFFEGSGFSGEITKLSEPTARQIANTFAKLLFPGNVQSAFSA